MDLFPPDARSSGVLFDRRRGATDAVSASSACELSGTAPENRFELSAADDARLFGFESELEKSLTYLPLAVRFNLDRCGVKLSLAAWQQLPEDRRRELLSRPCQSEADVAAYRKIVCAFATECTGEEPAIIAVAENPPWADEQVPEQLTRAATTMGLSSPSAPQWCRLTSLQRFALIKLSRDGREHRNLGAALREFGLLQLAGVRLRAPSWLLQGG